MDTSDTDVSASSTTSRMNRRTALRLTAFAAAATPLLTQVATGPAAHAQSADGDQADKTDIGQIDERTIAGLQADMRAGKTTSRNITSDYIARIQQLDPVLHSI